MGSIVVVCGGEGVSGRDGLWVDSLFGRRGCAESREFRESSNPGNMKLDANCLSNLTSNLDDSCGAQQIRSCDWTIFHPGHVITARDLPLTVSHCHGEMAVTHWNHEPCFLDGACVRLDDRGTLTLTVILYLSYLFITKVMG